MHRLIALVSLFLFLQASPANLEVPQKLTGKVTRVIDGDTFELRSARGTERIRMFGIDAPEHGQPFNQKSREYLSKLIAGQTVSLIVNRQDQYGRTVADVYVADKWINLAMVAGGYAWMYREFSNHPDLARAEKSAKLAKLGLWSATAEPPWEYRRRLREAKKHSTN